jgi:DNA-binding SARP family transcriptional activator/tetratricopeptide (TPR) repeat protein
VPGRGASLACVEFLLLGPVEVRSGGQRIAVGGPQAEKALAALLLAGGRVVGLDALVDALWDAEPPPTAVHQVHKLIAGLRQRVPGVIDTDGRGYRVRPGAGTLDLDRFEQLAAGAEIPDLVAALGLWRGDALAGVESRALRPAAAGLDGRRLAVLERLTDLRLAAGQAGAVATELPPLVAEHPLRETLRRQLMTALYRCGRQAEALGVYAETRTLLAEELGLDPGPELVRLHQQILRADPALQPDRPRAPCTLPYDVPDFSGRGGDLERLLHAGPAVVITAIDGMAGIGKTALAVHAAYRLADRFPDGQLFCDLHSHTPGARPLEPTEALERLLRMIGVPPETIPAELDEREARWRAELAGRRVLVVLDNAVSAAQVRPLLPGSARALVLVTSRRRLGVLDGATVLSLDVLPEAEALDLFGAVAGPERVAAEPAAAAEVVRLCGRLPLALRIAGSRLAHRPGWTVAALAARLRERTDRLGELTLADRGVGPAFALSYAQLAPAEQRMFRLLGVHPGADFDAWSAAALAGCTPREADSVLEALVDAHLLRSAAPGRYTFHDLIREYARSLAPAAAAPHRRLHDYYLAAATRAADLVAREARRFEPRLNHPPAHLPAMAGLDGALDWLSVEHRTLVEVTQATDDWQLACVLRPYFELQGHFADWRATHERLVDTPDPLGRAMVRFNLGGLCMWTGRLADGTDHLRHVLGTDDRQLEATTLTSLGMLAHLLHRDAEAAGYLRQALAIEHDSGRTRAFGWNNLALTEGRQGRAEAALRHHRRALAIAGQLDSPSAVRTVLLGLGETSLRIGRPAGDEFRRALHMAREARYPMHEALALDGLAHATGEPAYWREALVIFTDLGVAQADLVRQHLADPHGRWCDLCPATAAAAVAGRAGVR